MNLSKRFPCVARAHVKCFYILWVTWFHGRVFDEELTDEVVLRAGLMPVVSVLDCCAGRPSGCHRSVGVFWRPEALPLPNQLAERFNERSMIQFCKRDGATVPRQCCQQNSRFASWRKIWTKT